MARRKINRASTNAAGANVGYEAVEDDGEPFEEKMRRLVTQLEEQQAEAARLDDAIAANLREFGHGV